MHPANDARGGVDGATSDAPRARAHRRTSASPWRARPVASALAALTAVILVAVAAARAPVSASHPPRLGADAPTPGATAGVPAGLRFIPHPQDWRHHHRVRRIRQRRRPGACVKQQRTDGDESDARADDVQFPPAPRTPGRIRPGLFLRQAQPVHPRGVAVSPRRRPTPAVSQAPATLPGRTCRRHSCASLARYINLRLNRVENNRLVPCLMRDAETRLCVARVWRRERAEAQGRGRRAREAEKDGARGRAGVERDAPERKTEAETVSAVREARLPAKKAEGVVSERETATCDRRRVPPATARRGSAPNATATSSVFFRRLCDARSRARAGAGWTTGRVRISPRTAAMTATRFLSFCTRADANTSSALERFPTRR